MEKRYDTLGEEVNGILEDIEGMYSSVVAEIARREKMRAKLAQQREKVLELKRKIVLEDALNAPSTTARQRLETTLAASRDPFTRSNDPMWKIIAKTMSGRERFTMTEAGTALERELGRSLGGNRPQTVRNNLVRHPETFRQNLDSTWTVVRDEREVLD